MESYDLQELQEFVHMASRKHLHNIQWESLADYLETNYFQNVGGAWNRKPADM